MVFRIQPHTRRPEWLADEAGSGATWDVVDAAGLSADYHEAVLA